MNDHLSQVLSYIRRGDKLSPHIVAMRLKITIAAARALYYDALAVMHVEAKMLAKDIRGF